MMKPVYITSASAISPQRSFEEEAFLREIISSENGKLFVQEPDYRPFINPVAIRRMSRLIKMGIACGMNALQKANVQTPDAIITGTGLGSMTDTERFLKDMILFNEETLNPTFFIQSTYNSVNGWISLQTKSNGYNQTYVNRGHSLEMALLDAQLFLNEATKTSHVLAGGFDELTDEYFVVKNKVDYWKKNFPVSKDLLKNNESIGTIGGEGAAFFVLSNDATNACCQLAEVKLLREVSAEKLQLAIDDLLTTHELTKEDIDVIIIGKNGDARFENLYDQIASKFEYPTLVAYKHLTGEYPTATGLGVWLGTQLFSSKEIKEALVYRKGRNSEVQNILIVNHYVLNTMSLLFLKGV